MREFGHRAFSRRRLLVGSSLTLVAAGVGLMLTFGVPEPQGCGGPAEEESPPSAYDDSGAERREETLPSGYRTGCGKAIVHSGIYALHGDVVTPTGVIPGGYVVVTGETITAVNTSAQGAGAGVTTIETNGFIFPGLIDGHGHVEYNHIPIANLGKRYQDRDQWPGAALYQTLVKDPKNAVDKAGISCEAIKHGELRGLVGGTTAIQGTPSLACVKSLVRNLEQLNFCQDRVRQNVMDIAGFTRSISKKPSFAQSIASDIAANKLDAVVVHAGEGIDAHELAEWGQLKAINFNKPQLVMIHTAAFTDAQYKEIAAAGSKIVWSPLSNLLLYGQTADIPSAMKEGVMVCLGSDWSPSGSPNVLAELKVADHVNQRLWKGSISDSDLVNMVTIHPAIAFGIDKFVGSIAVGKVADLMVVAKESGKTAWRSLIDARPQDVLLVTIAGDPLFGATAFMDTLGKKGDYEIIDACGTPRGIDVTVTAADVPGGTETLADIESKLKAVNPQATPVIECGNAAALAAYAGTPLQ